MLLITNSLSEIYSWTTITNWKICHYYLYVFSKLQSYFFRQARNKLPLQADPSFWAYTRNVFCSYSFKNILDIIYFIRLKQNCIVTFLLAIIYRTSLLKSAHTWQTSDKKGKLTVIACITICGSWWFSRLTMARRQSFGPFAVVTTLSHMSIICPHSSDVFFSSVAFSETHTKSYTATSKTMELYDFHWTTCVTRKIII